MLCIIEGLRDKNERGVALDNDSEVVYIGVTLEQAKRNAWNLLKDFARPVTTAAHENTSVLTLANGVRIRLLGMDNPDAARGMKLRFAILDEYADMPPNVWTEIIRPALMDVQGGALFIGTPKGKNHFYQLFLKALRNDPGYEDWEAFNFTSADNPTLDRKELHGMASEYTNGSDDLHAQEIEAKFISRGGRVFHADHFKISAEEPQDGDWHIAVDLAGFITETFGSREIKKRDDTAIAIVKVDARDGWWVKEIIHGKWDVRETAYKIVSAAMDCQASKVGIEKGVLAQAVEPYLREYMTRYNRWLNIVPLTHGNRNKYDRIQWALQGRAQKGHITLNPGPWNEVLLDQAVDFPSRLSHDDLLDALAYIDQLAEPSFFNMDGLPGEFEPLDAISGY